MSEIQYVERVPRRSDFCGCPPCPVCYDPVITDDQKAPAFEEVMTEIYGEGPKPQTEQEYEWAHVAAHQCREELKTRSTGDFFEADRARMTQMQIDDLLKQAKRAADAPKPLNTVNLDDMPVEAIGKMTKENEREEVDAKKRQPAFTEQYLQNQYYQQQVALSQLLQPKKETKNLPNMVWFLEPATPGGVSGGSG